MSPGQKCAMILLLKPLLMLIAQGGTRAAEGYLLEQFVRRLPDVLTLQPDNQNRPIQISTASVRRTESSSKRF